jgi:hypothetical protein
MRDAASVNPGRLRARTAWGVGNRERKATDHSTHVDSQYRAISGKYNGK